MSEENTPVTTPGSGGWLDRRLDRRARKQELKRLNERAELRNKIDRRADRDELAHQRLDKLALATRTVMISGPIIAPMAVAWTGQAGFAMKVIGWDFPAAIVYAAAYELTTAFCGWMYHESRKDGDNGLEYRFATWAFASGSATQQWWHYSDHWSATPRSVTFASMTMIGLAVWELYARLIHRRKLRKDKMRTTPLPKLGVVRWIRFPRLSWSAWSIMVRTGIRDLDQAWTRAEQERSARRTSGRRFWTRHNPADQRTREEVGGWTSTDQTVDQLGPLPEWAVQRLDQPDQSGPDHANPSAGRTETDQDRTPQVDQPDRVPELEPAPVNNPEPVRPAPAQTDDFEPTDLEREAIEYMLANGITINRRNVGDVIRNHEGFKTAINTTRAGQVARWGREQGGSSGQLRAV